MKQTPPSASDPELRMLSAELDAALNSGEPHLASPPPGGGSAAGAGRPGMERHRRIAGVVTIMMGILIVVGTVAVVSLLGVAGYLSGAHGTALDVRPLLLGVAVGTAIMIAGAAFVRGHPAARAPVAVFAVLSLVAFPVGTAVGVYVLWTLVNLGRSG